LAILYIEGRGVMEIKKLNRRKGGERNKKKLKIIWEK
jgi:hypothetical protein